MDHNLWLSFPENGLDNEKTEISTLCDLRPEMNRELELLVYFYHLNRK